MEQLQAVLDKIMGVFEIIKAFFEQILGLIKPEAEEPVDPDAPTA